jgi:hypothetical protein
MFALVGNRGYATDSKTCNTLLQTDDIFPGFIGRHYRLAEGRKIITKLFRLMQTQKRRGWWQMVLKLARMKVLF